MRFFKTNRGIQGPPHEYSCGGLLPLWPSLLAVFFIAAGISGAQGEANTVAPNAESVASATIDSTKAEPAKPDVVKPDEAVGAALNIPNADAQTQARFRAECTAKAKAAEKAYAIAVAGRGGWLFFAPELRHIGAGKFWGEDAERVSQSSLPENADPLPAILDFKKQLDRAGIELLMVPVPPKAVIYPDMISSVVNESNGLKRVDSAHQEFYALLRQNGIAVLDLTPDFLTHRLDASGALYCRQDTHWSGRACVFAARQIVATTEGRAWRQATFKRNFAQQWKSVPIKGDLLSDNNKTKHESLPLRFITAPNPNANVAKADTTRGMSTHVAAGAVPYVATDINSPVLLLGDSHTLVFHEGGDMHTRGAGLADQLAFEFGFSVGLIGVRGSGATPARTSLMRRARSNPNYLKNKKLVIWCFSAREWTESAGWNLVPVVK